MITVLSKNDRMELLNKLNLNEEIKEHPTMPNIYVTRSGKVLSLTLHTFHPKAFIRKESINPTTGYHQIHIKYDGVTWSTYTHRIVLQTFLPQPDNDEDWVVDHIDNDKANNKLVNLQWLTRTDNLKKRDEDGRLFKLTYIYDNETRLVKRFESRIEAAKYIDMFRSNLTKYLKLGKCVRGRYLISDKYPSVEEQKNMEINIARKDVTTYVYDRNIHNVIEYKNVEEAAIATGLQISNVNSAIKYGGVIKGRYYITDTDCMFDEDYRLVFKEYDLKQELKEVRQQKQETLTSKNVWSAAVGIRGLK